MAAVDMATDGVEWMEVACDESGLRPAITD